MASAFLGVEHAVHVPPHPLFGSLMSTHTPPQLLVPGPQFDPASFSIAPSNDASVPTKSEGSLPRIELQPTMQASCRGTKSASARKSRFTSYLAFRKRLRLVRPRRRA